MGLTYQQAKTVGLGHLHPAASGRTDDQIIRELAGEPPKGHKYRAQRTEYNGRKYPSKAQATRAYQLDMMVEHGTIHAYLEEVTFRLGPDFRYRADFVVIDRAVMLNAYPIWAEDVKGFITPRFKTAVKLWRKYGVMPLHIIGTKSTEVIRGGA